MKEIIIAIDGLSSAGKSTMAKGLAKEIGYAYIDTGAMYRAVTLYALQNGLCHNGEIDETGLRAALPNISIDFRADGEGACTATYLNGLNVERDIRNMPVAALVSSVAALPFVRSQLVDKQRDMGRRKGVVMDGRDIGTVVFPHAELKIFVTATPEIRAQRRLDELLAKGEQATFDEVLENVKKRDLIDSTRTDSPLKKADDALTLDTSQMSIGEQKNWLLKQYAAIANK
ncbi:MAG: (d)CMP kinase [Tannerellaceae bacterium]|nr:(d)CMP kinase [Tannerellaceae bacterium]